MRAVGVCWRLTTYRLRNESPSLEKSASVLRDGLVVVVPLAADAADAATAAAAAAGALIASSTKDADTDEYRLIGCQEYAPPADAYQSVYFFPLKHLSSQVCLGCSMKPLALREHFPAAKDPSVVYIGLHSLAVMNAYKLNCNRRV